MEFQIKTTKANELVDITDKVGELVARSGTKGGICLIYAPHATAAIIINEFEPNIASDFGNVFQRLVPKADYMHNMIDDNAEAHIKSALLDCGKCIPIENGELVLGTWQRIILCEFDGPRSRTVKVSIAKG